MPHSPSVRLSVALSVRPSVTCCFQLPSYTFISISPSSSSLSQPQKVERAVEPDVFSPPVRFSPSLHVCTASLSVLKRAHTIR